MVLSRSSRSSSSSSGSSSSGGGSQTPKAKQPNWWRRLAGHNQPSSGENEASSGSPSALRSARNAILLGAAQTFLPAYSSTNNNSDHNGMSNSRRSSQHETSPLLANGDEHAVEANRKTRGVVWGALTTLFAVALILILVFEEAFGEAFGPWFGIMPKDPVLAALVILDNAPVIDGHIDLPMLVRSTHANNVSAIDLEATFPGHVDIPRLRQGKVGGFFWSAYVACPNQEMGGKNFLNATWRVRDTLEQIDVAKLLIAKYPQTFKLALSAGDIEQAISERKIASLLGVEGGHQLGNSIAVLRQYQALGVRYVTLTHTCHNAFADSCGYYPGIIPLHHGLSAFGITLIEEMNRLGVLVDLSHTSDATASQAIKVSKAPVIWSHSSARAVHDVPRNVPDHVLRLLGEGDGKNDGVVMVNFAPFFVAEPGKATVEAVADHVEHIALVAGKQHVGIGSDFDGIDEVPVGLEDVSKYPALIAELYRRGWNKYELAGLTGANLLRVLRKAERVAQELQATGTLPKFDLYDKRQDIPRAASDL